jgi:flagellum-specific ATP synthase
MIDVVDPEHIEAAIKTKASMAVYRDREDMIQIGAYVRGSSPEVDLAIKMRGPILSFLKQKIQEPSDFATTRASVLELAKGMA